MRDPWLQCFNMGTALFTDSYDEIPSELTNLRKCTIFALKNKKNSD